MKRILILTSTILLAGCGGGSSSSGSAPSGPVSDTKMVPSKLYTVYQGDQIVKTSETAHIAVSYVDGLSEYTVKLLDGEATIIRKK